MAKEICISSTPHETRLAILEDDQLAEIYYERENEYTLAGSIYNGRVTRVLPGMQSAFVDLGLERDAFLYVTDFIELEDQEETDELEKAAASGADQAPREVRHPQGGDRNGGRRRSAVATAATNGETRQDARREKRVPPLEGAAIKRRCSRAAGKRRDKRPRHRNPMKRADAAGAAADAVAEAADPAVNPPIQRQPEQVYSPPARPVAEESRATFIHEPEARGCAACSSRTANPRALCPSGRVAFKIRRRAWRGRPRNAPEPAAPPRPASNSSRPR